MEGAVSTVSMGSLSQKYKSFAYRIFERFLTVTAKLLMVVTPL